MPECCCEEQRAPVMAPGPSVQGARRRDGRGRRPCVEPSSAGCFPAYAPIGHLGLPAGARKRGGRAATACCSLPSTAPALHPMFWRAMRRPHSLHTSQRLAIFVRVLAHAQAAPSAPHLCPRPSKVCAGSRTLLPRSQAPQPAPPMQLRGLRQGAGAGAGSLGAQQRGGLHVGQGGKGSGRPPCRPQSG